MGWPHGVAAVSRSRPIESPTSWQALPVEQRSARVAQLASAMHSAAGRRLSPNRWTARIARWRWSLPPARARPRPASMSPSGSPAAAVLRTRRSRKTRPRRRPAQVHCRAHRRLAAWTDSRDVIDAARLFYIGQQSAGLSPSPQGAVALALGGPLTEHAGKEFRCRRASTADKLQRYPVQDIAAQAPDGFVYLPGGRPMGVPEFLGALPSAQLEPAGRPLSCARADRWC